MAYTTPDTKSTGDPAYTAAEINEFGANFAVSAPDLFATKGDIIAATGAKAAARVGIGADGLILHYNPSQSAGVQWRKPEYGGSARGITSLATGTAKVAPTGTEYYDTDSTLNASTFTFVARATGYYCVSCSLYFDHNQAQWDENEICYLYISVGASAGHVFAARAAQSSHTEYMYISGTTIVYLEHGETMYIYMYQTSGGTQYPTNNIASVFRIA